MKKKVIDKILDIFIGLYLWTLERVFQFLFFIGLMKDIDPKEIKKLYSLIKNEKYEK